MQLSTVIETVNYILAVLFFICYSYQFLFIPLVHCKRDAPHKTPQLHRYAILICARNEEKVIGNLIGSIKKQDYPAAFLHIFVAADNCTDHTAQIARESGATVYERFNRKEVGKGYAIRFLLDRIHRDFGENSFDGYFVFDADNLLKSDYISRMNETFSDGCEIVTSYRNSKNYADSWISAGYALWFLRESEYLNHARMLLGTSCAVSGTGFLFSRQILQKCGGWRFFLLTEDIEFSVYNILNGEKIGYCKDACLYDEQPVTFRQSCRQRLRWAKGYMQVFLKYGARLVSGIFGKNAFSCFDMCMNIMPAMILSFFGIVFNLVGFIAALIGGTGLSAALFSVLQSLFNGSLVLFLIGAITTLTQWRQINAKAPQKLFYTLTFPIFMFTYLPISLVALVRRVEWLPIRHDVDLSIDEIPRASHKRPILRAK